MNKTTLKARCGTEIRKNWIHHNNDMSMNDLVAKMQRYFNIGDAAAIKLKYRDEEKEWVTLTDDDELAYALTTMHEQLYVDVIGADNAVGETAGVHTEVKEPAKMTQKESPATPLSSIGELTEIPLSGLGTPPAVVGKLPSINGFVGAAISQQPQHNELQQRNAYTPVAPPNTAGVELTEIPLGNNDAQHPTQQHIHFQHQPPFGAGLVEVAPRGTPPMGTPYNVAPGAQQQPPMAQFNVKQPPMMGGQQPPQQANNFNGSGHYHQPPSSGAQMGGFAPPPISQAQDGYAMQPPMSAGMGSIAPPPVMSTTLGGGGAMGGGGMPAPPPVGGQPPYQAPLQQPPYYVQQPGMNMKPPPIGGSPMGGGVPPQQQMGGQQPPQHYGMAPPPQQDGSAFYGGAGGGHHQPPPPISSVVGPPPVGGVNPFSRQQHR